MSKATKSRANSTFNPTARGSKRAAIYARVSSEEQTKGNYPSCASQVEELEAACKGRAWTVQRVVRDEGFSAGSLNRPGLTELRWLIQNGEIDVVICTWYDRLTRSRDFYVLDKEFKAHSVEFVTLHDATDTKTASGRFMESMLVAAKTYEREQTSEKVRSKMRMRAEKGMWNGGPIPFGFVPVDKARTITPDAEKQTIVNEMFRVYIETASDFKVRDWLKAHQIPTREGRPQWQVSTIAKLLTNRRYIAQIEVNRENKGVEGLPESDAYRVVAAPYEPIVPTDVFESAQQIRQEKASAQPNRVGRPRSYSQTQCQRHYPLQGLIVCRHCGHALAPWYVRHKAGEDKSGKKRKNDSYIHYYLCAGQQKNWKGSDHKNCTSASKSENWVLDRLRDLATSEELVQEALEMARSRSRMSLQPVYDAYQETGEALRKVEVDIEQMMETISSGKAVGALWEMLNEKAFRLKFERDQLVAEQRSLKERMAPAEVAVDAAAFCKKMRDFEAVRKTMRPEEVQRLLRLLVKRVEWAPQKINGDEVQVNHRVQFYVPPLINKLPTDSMSRQAVVSYCDTLRYLIAYQFRTTTLFEIEFTPEIEPLPETALLTSLVP